MCGIVGLIGRGAVRHELMRALAALEYRGYDSAGAVVASPGFTLRKVVGGVAALDAAFDAIDSAGCVGIAHTRWATHGRPEARNAHPHVWDGVAVVHNGIIENHAELRAELRGRGHEFVSETDSEVLPHLIADAVADGMGTLAAIRHVCGRLRGAYALAILFEATPQRIIVARHGSPVVLGRGADGRVAVASDPAALAGICHDYAALEDGQFAMLRHDRVRLMGPDLAPLDPRWEAMHDDGDDAEAYAEGCHTRREIAEQPVSLGRTDAALRGRPVPEVLQRARRLAIIACGSSLYAAAVARPWIERLAGVPCDLEVASEYRYREPLIAPGTVGVLVSQSGETADTLAVFEQMRGRRVPVVGVVNVAHSTLARGADVLWPTVAGREKGVAATKSFTAQLLALLRLGLAIGVARGEVAAPDIAALERGFAEAPAACLDTIALEPTLARIARGIAAEDEALFIGRGWAAAMAAEAALKLKELSYIRADAYPAGELKHGPIALIRERSPVLLLAPGDGLLAKTASTAEEVAARGASVTVLTDAAGADAFADAAEVIVLPGDGVAHVFAHAVAVQLIAYHAALELGRNVDRPRNLAKSVTVE